MPFEGTSIFGVFLSDLVHFKRNADQKRELARQIAALKAERFRGRELALENQRLVKLLELKHSAPPQIKTKIAARVIGRSQILFERVLWINKGRQDGLRPDMLVLSGLSVIGKISECSPSASRVLLVTDPGFRLGVIVQRTRHQGVLYGLSLAAGSGLCRVKYLPLDADIRAGDSIETAGFGATIPKGLNIGAVKKSFRIPGHVYQTAEIAPEADLERVEEVLVVE